MDKTGFAVLTPLAIWTLIVCTLTYYKIYYLEHMCISKSIYQSHLAEGYINMKIIMKGKCLKVGIKIVPSAKHTM